MDEVRKMERRSDDPPGITLDRKIPLWGIFTIGFAILGQGVLLWAASREASIEQKHLTARVSELTLEVKSMATQMSVKSESDLQQNADIRELQRRMADIERTKGR
jgi:hypothetical protein